MTPATVYDDIRAQCNETADSSGLWTDAEILRHMTMAENIIAQEIGTAFEDSTSFTTGDGTREYTLGSTVGPIFRLEWDEVRLQEVDINQLGDVEGEAYGGVDTTGSPEYYYRSEDTVLGFSPVPDSAKTCTIYHHKIPSAISSKTDTTWSVMPLRYGQYVSSYALWRMFLKDDQLKETAVAYKSEWNESLRTIRHDQAKTKFNDRYAVARPVDPIFID